MFIIEEINSENGFISIRDEWNDLFNKTSDISIFQAYDFVKTWWDTYKDNKVLRLLIVRTKKENRAVAILPLYQDSRYGFITLRFICDNFGDCIHILTSISESKLAGILGTYFVEYKNWARFIFNGVVSESSTDKILNSLFSLEFYRHSEVTVNAPRTNIQGCWHDYFNQLGKKLRKNTVYQARRLKKLGHLNLIEITGHSLETELDIFFSMHQQRWSSNEGKTLFQNPDNREFFSKITAQFDKNGLLAFTKLLVGKEVVAMHLGFKFNNCFYYYIPAFNQRFAKYSPGRIMVVELMKDIFEKNFKVFDFLAGDEEYKLAFSNEVVKFSKVEIFNHNVKGRLHHFYKNRLKLKVS